MIGSIETGMNGSSLPNHENRFYDSPPPHGLFEARRGKEVLVFFVIEPPRGALRGGGVYRIWGYGGFNSHYIIPDGDKFYGKSSFYPAIWLYSSIILRVAPSPPQRGRQRKGSVTLTPWRNFH